MRRIGYEPIKALCARSVRTKQAEHPASLGAQPINYRAAELPPTTYDCASTYV